MKNQQSKPINLADMGTDHEHRSETIASQRLSLALARSANGDAEAVCTIINELLPHVEHTGIRDHLEFALEESGIRPGETQFHLRQARQLLLADCQMVAEFVRGDQV